jgi:hypothetical protein
MQEGTGTLVPATPDPMLTQFDASQLTAEQVRTVLDAAPLIRARLKDIEDRATQMLQNREGVPGYKLVRSVGNRKWSLDEDEIAKKLKNMKIPKDVYTKTVVRSPSDLQKQGLQTKTWDLVQKYIVRPEGGLTLAPASDKRPDAMAALEHFKPVETAPAEAAPATYDFLN